MELITGEAFENKDPALVKEYNELCNETRYIYHLSKDEILSKHYRLNELRTLLCIENHTKTQLELF